MSLIEKARYLVAQRPKDGYRDVEYSRSTSSEGRLSSEDEGSHDELLEKDFPHSERVRSLWRRHTRLIVFHGLLFIVYIGVLYSVATHRSKDIRSIGLPFSPAIEALEYRSQTFSLEDKIQERGSFSGKPSPELDQAWHDLLNAENIKLEPEVMKHYGREDSGVALPEGNGYIGTLNVYHEIHCLKRLHQYMYQDYYWPDLDAHQLEMNRLHNEHCIDFLRQAAMCHGDVGLITFEWKAESRIPVANATTHQCVDWEKLDKWTKERTVDMMKPGWLVHPTLGLAYPDGQGDRIGAVEIPAPGHGEHAHTKDESDDATGY